MRYFVLVILLASAAAVAADVQSNSDLMEIKNKDQAARARPMNAIEVRGISGQDAERRKQVAAILRRGEVKTSDDYFNAALIYQHGQTIDDIRLAYSLATIAVSIDPDNKSARWLTAAAWDRIMMRQGQPQWYGTQFVRSNDTEAWQLYKIEESIVLDEDRKYHGVLPLAEQRARAAKIR